MDDPRVLIVEDRDVLRALFFTLLSHQPLSVDTASSVDVAMEKILTCDYALILIDMDIARDGAREFLERMREERPGSTTFVLAVRSPNSDLVLDPRLVNAVLSKPVELGILAEVVRETALTVEPPADQLTCPPAESDAPSVSDRFVAN